jgi:hypothetical protein
VLKDRPKHFATRVLAVYSVNFPLVFQEGLLKFPLKIIANVKHSNIYMQHFYI